MVLTEFERDMAELERVIEREREKQRIIERYAIINGGVYDPILKQWVPRPRNKARRS